MQLEIESTLSVYHDMGWFQISFRHFNTVSVPDPLIANSYLDLENLMPFKQTE